jgi:hypothetical protein
MFEVRVNGQPVHKEEAQVIGVSLMSARGELYKAGISTEGVIDVVLQTVSPADPIRLDQLDEARLQFERDRVAGVVVGTAPGITADMGARQTPSGAGVLPGYEGGKNVSQGQQPPPSRDLSEGLDPADSEALTKRIEAYNESGDADKAIEDNPPTGSEPPPEPEAPAPDEEPVDPEPPSLV